MDDQIRLNYTFIGTSSSDGWETMHAQDGRYTLGHFGPEVTFSRALKKAGYNPAIFKYTKGATNIYYNWKTPGKGGYYDNMVAKLATSIAQLEAEGHTVNVRGFVWIQGESDATKDVMAAAYRANLSSIMTDFRNNVVKDSQLPIILGVDEQHGGVVARPEVLHAHQDMALNDSLISFTSMHGLVKATGDATHLSPASLEIHGKQIFETYALLVSGELETSECTLSSAGSNVSSLSNSSWGQSFKTNCSGYLSEIVFNSATALSGALTFSISNGSNCSATLLHSQSISSLVDGDNSVFLNEDVYLNKEHTYYINITSDTDETWQVRFSKTNNVVGNLITYTQGEAASTCNANFAGFDWNFSVILGEKTVSNIETAQINEVYLYPNPTQGNVTIHLNNKEDVSIKILDISGQIIYTESDINAFDYTLELGDIRAGIYLVQVNEGGRLQQYKLIRE